MTKSTAAALALTAALSGCATDKPLMQQASEGFNSARASVANAIAPSSAASATTASNPQRTGSTTNTSVTEQKKKGVAFMPEYANKADSAVVNAGRSFASKFSSLNGEYVKVTVSDSVRGTKAAPAVYVGKIFLESCSPTVMGTAATVGTSLLDRGAALLGRAGANALPGGGGAAGNVLRTQTQRQATTSATDAKASILSGATNLTAEQQTACKADMAFTAAEIKEATSKFVADYKAANQRSNPVVTITGTADLKDLQLGGVTTRAPR